MLKPKGEVAVEVGVAVVPRLTVIICGIILIDMFIDYVCICRKRDACIYKQKFTHKSFLD